MRKPILGENTKQAKFFAEDFFTWTLSAGRHHTALD
jgi:hypothetical protein